jgi:hypothetical protein
MDSSLIKAMETLSTAISTRCLFSICSQSWGPSTYNDVAARYIKLKQRDLLAESTNVGEYIHGSIPHLIGFWCENSISARQRPRCTRPSPPPGPLLESMEGNYGTGPQAINELTQMIPSRLPTFRLHGPAWLWQLDSR